MNRAYFLTRVKASVFAGRLSKTQIDGLAIILDAWEKTRASFDDRLLAYILATAAHETNHTMQPIREIGNAAYFTRMYDIRGERPETARALGNARPGDGAMFPGMGFVQSTGRGNARKARSLVFAALGESVDFESDPKLLMVPKYAAVVLVEGMMSGMFSGAKLPARIHGAATGDALKAQFEAARTVVNGHDRAGLIAGYAMAFYDALCQARAPAPVGLADIPGDDVEDDPSTGKSMISSKTNIAAAIGTSTGLVATASSIVDTLKQARDTAGDAWSMAMAAGPWMLAAAAIAVAGALIISERMRHARENGI
jgi:putative chitinase